MLDRIDMHVEVPALREAVRARHVAESLRYRGAAAPRACHPAVTA